MGAKDKALKRYLSDNNVIADIFYCPTGSAYGLWLMAYVFKTIYGLRLINLRY